MDPGVTLDPEKEPRPLSSRPRPLTCKEIFHVLFLGHGNDIQTLTAYYQVFYPVILFDFDGQHFKLPARGKLWIWAPVSVYLLVQIFRYVRTIGHLAHVGHLQHVFIMIYWSGSQFSTVVHLWTGWSRASELSYTLNTWKELRTGDTTIFTYVIRSLMPIGIATTGTIVALFLYNPTLPYFVINDNGLDPYGGMALVLYPLFILHETLTGYIVFGSHFVCDAYLIGICTTFSQRLELLAEKTHGGGARDRKSVV